MQVVFDRNDSHAIMKFAHRLARAAVAGGGITYAAAFKQALKRAHAAFKMAVKGAAFASEWRDAIDASRDYEVFTSKYHDKASGRISLSEITRIAAHVSSNEFGDKAHLVIETKHHGEWYLTQYDVSVWLDQPKNIDHRLEKCAQYFSVNNLMQQFAFETYI